VPEGYPAPASQLSADIDELRETISRIEQATASK
jgi:hypothetical protein